MIPTDLGGRLSRSLMGWTVALLAVLLGGSCARVGFESHGDSGVIDGSSVDRLIEGLILRVEPQFAQFADWNAYFRTTQPAEACDGTESGGYAACTHGGERRRVEVPGESSCAELMLHEELGLFDWTCDDADGVVFSTTGLASRYGLAQLVRADGFRENSVSVRRRADGSVVGRSEPEVWGWANPVRPLPPSGAEPAVRLQEAGAIYTVEQSTSGSGYNVDANRIAIVTLDDAVLSYDGTSEVSCNARTGEVTAADEHCLIAAGAQSFLWIEAKIDGGDESAMVERALLLSNVTFSRIHRTTILNAATVSVTFRYETHNNLISELSITSIGLYGLFLNGDDNVFQDITIENVVASGLDMSTYAERNRFINLRVARTGNLGYAALAVRGDDNCFFNLVVHKSEHYGVMLMGSRNIVVNAYLSNHRYSGFRVWDGEPKEGNIIVGVLAAHNGVHGGYLQAGRGTTVSHVTAAANGICGIRTGVTGSLNERSTLNQVLAVNNREYGLHIVGQTGSDSHLFSRVVTAHNHVYNILLQTGDAHRFVGDLWVSEPANNCRVSSTSPAPGLIDGSCTDTGQDQSSSYLGQESTAMLHVGVDLRETFVCEITQDDVSNPDDLAGAAEAAGITDFLRFDNPWRAWGVGVSGFPDPAQAGRCLSGPCRIWDWQVRRDDTALRQINGEFVPGMTCPAAVHGDEAITDSQELPHTFLVNAVEIVLDGVGNDNGLCEAGEHCVFSPGIGAYLGGGALMAEPCVFQDGLVSGVTMYAYAEDGA